MVREAEKSISDSAREALPIPKHGGDRKSRDIQGDIGNGRSRGSVTTSTSKGKRDAEYLTARIARDHKDIHERMKAGEFSVAHPHASGFYDKLSRRRDK